jgi:hypothetical protein
MAVSAIIGIVFVALLVAACWYVFRNPPSAADERRALDESKMHAEQDIVNASRRPGTYGRN